MNIQQLKESVDLLIQAEINEYNNLLPAEDPLRLGEEEVETLVKDFYAALEAYIKKRGEPTEIEADTLLKSLSISLVDSAGRKQAQKLSPNSPENRKERKAILKTLQEKHHISFRKTGTFVMPTNDSELLGTFSDLMDTAEFPPVPKNEPEPTEEVPRSTVDTAALIHCVDAMQSAVQLKADKVIAYKYHLDHHNKVSIEFAVSFCSPKDRFDALMGKEEALTRFIAGKTMKIAIRDMLDPELAISGETVLKYIQTVLKADGVARRYLK